MKTFGLILYTLMGIWAFYSFDTSKIILIGKYVIGNFVASPIKTSSFALALILTIICLGVVISKGFMKPIQNQMAVIEPIPIHWKEQLQYNVENFNRSEYIKLYETLNKNNNKNLSDRELILKFLENSKRVYRNLPEIIEEETQYNTKYVNFNRVTQVTMLKIKKYQHSILFISHNPNKPDRLVDIYNYDELPDNRILHQVLDPIFDDENLNKIRIQFDTWPNAGTIHGGVGFAASLSPVYEWLWIGVPHPFKDHNLNNLIAESLGFQSLI